MTLSYPPVDEFGRTLRRRVRAYLREPGVRRHARRQLVSKAVTLLVGAVASYALLLSGAVRGIGLSVVQLVFMVSLFIIALGVVHDATHEAYLPRSWINRIIVKYFDLIGVDSHYWINNHVHSHHVAPNVPSEDAAIEGFDVLRLHPGARHLWAHRYQHLYAPLVYGFVTLFQSYVLEFASVVRGVIGFRHGDGHQIAHWIRMVIMKTIALSITLFLPMMMLEESRTRILVGFFAGHFIAGLLLGFFFQLTHISAGNEFPRPSATGRLPRNFVRHVLRTTADFATDSAVITWMSGGLNHHVAHHLYPRVPHVLLPAITEITRVTAEEFEAPYRVNGALAAIRLHFHLLQRLGAQAEPKLS